MFTDIAVIILAAGLGTRMKSKKAKVLHTLLGKPMVLYVVETAMQVVGRNVILVVGNQAEHVRQTVAEKAELTFAFQEEQRGTGHAVQCALPYLQSHIAEVVILCGDVPLIAAQTVIELIEDHRRENRDVSILAVEIDDPRGYGRILFDGYRQVCGIVEESDATAEQKRIKIVNSGIYCVKKNVLVSTLPKVRSDNVKGEIYLTDVIHIGYGQNKKIGALIGNDYQEVMGINTIEELHRVESILQSRERINA